MKKGLVVPILLLVSCIEIQLHGFAQEGTNTDKKYSIELIDQGIRAVKREKFIEAEGYFKKALEKDPANLIAVFNLAGMYVANKKGKLAIEILKPYTEKYPEDPGILMRLGDAFFVEKQLSSAVEYYEKASKRSPNYPGVSGKLGELYSLLGRFKEAEAMYSHAVKLEPQNTQFLSTLSGLYLENGKIEESVAAAKAALQLKATSELYIILGNAYQELKDKKNALIAYQRALDLGSTDSEVKRIVEQLSE